MSRVIEPHAHPLGGSQSAIQYHYDVGTDFYALWLDRSLTYSCALWNDNGETSSLEAGQAAKYAWHLNATRAYHARSLLDIGCGWGGLLSIAAKSEKLERAVGLTLSDSQFAHISGLMLPKVEVRLENWAAYNPQSQYEAIVSIGALEHFVRPEHAPEQKIEIYRTFFSYCRDWLAPGGRMSLQTIAYGDMLPSEASAFINDEIFPSADLPRLSQLAAAADQVLEIIEVQNHRLHYARTFEIWAKNLTRSRAASIELVGEEITERYIRYLTQSAIGFHMGKIQLLRLVLGKSRR